jgi:hypothetical protein
MSFIPVQQVFEVPQAVYIIWALLLAFILLGVAPLTVFLLYRTLRIARFLEQNLAEALTAGVGVAEHTSHVKALEETIRVASTILSVAGRINNSGETVKTTLAARAGRTNGHH